jgi:hypothetical protein
LNQVDVAEEGDFGSDFIGGSDFQTRQKVTLPELYLTYF